MTLAYWMLLVAIVLPYAFTGVAKAGGGFKLKDNHNPRDFLANLEGARKRAHWAQLNSFEVTPAFAVALLMAHQIGAAAQGTLDTIAVVFVVARVAYGVCYIADWASLRSLVWFASMACIIAFFVVSA